MYSTKHLNKNQVDNNAYITIGDPFKDPPQNVFRQGKKGDKAVKPFQIKQSPENEQNGHFSKIVYGSSPYRETNLYITTQPLDSRKKGFGSKDAHRRDEFSNAVRTQQYRESIHRENQLRGSTLDERMKAILAAHEAKTASTSPASKSFQFDIGRGKVTDFDPKATRDSYYKVIYSLAIGIGFSYYLFVSFSSILRRTRLLEARFRLVRILEMRLGRSAISPLLSEGKARSRIFWINLI